MKAFGRLLAAMITPFNADMTLDLAGAKALASHLVEGGCDGLVVSGSTGEAPTLTAREKLQLFEAVVDEVGGRASVVAGTGGYSTAESIELSLEAQRIGVDGVMLVTPYYNKPPQRALVEHFRSIADALDVPVILYNIPGRTARNIDPPTVAELSKVKNIVAIKEASGDMDHVSRIRASTSSDFIIYSGNDSQTLPIMALGGFGVISVAAHVAPALMKEMIEAFILGKLAKALDLHLKLMPLFDALFIDTNPIPVKYAAKLLGLPSGGLRLPLVDIRPEDAARVKAAVAGLGLL